MHAVLHVDLLACAEACAHTLTRGAHDHPEADLDAREAQVQHQGRRLMAGLLTLVAGAAAPRPRGRYANATSGSPRSSFGSGRRRSSVACGCCGSAGRWRPVGTVGTVGAPWTECWVWRPASGGRAGCASGWRSCGRICRFPSGPALAQR